MIRRTCLAGNIGRTHACGPRDREGRKMHNAIQPRRCCGRASLLLRIAWALVAVTNGSTAVAATDPRIGAVETAWNRGDALGVQAGWTLNLDADALGSQARLATTAEHGGLLTVLASERVAPKIYAASVLLND